MRRGDDGREVRSTDRAREAILGTHNRAGEAGAGVAGCRPEQRVWAFLDSNQRPLPYQGSALTS